MSTIVVVRSNLTARAKAFAAEKHRGQTRTNKAKDPYIIHLEEVARLVAESGGSEVEIAAAWLHDTVEDTKTSVEEIRYQFGLEVAHIVDVLTDNAATAKLSIPERKLVQAIRVSGQDKSAKRVKLADQTSNARLCALDPPTNWSKSEVLQYVEGAEKVAFACAGVSEFLDEEFRKAHRDAMHAIAPLHHLSS